MRTLITARCDMIHTTFLRPSFRMMESSKMFEV